MSLLFGGCIFVSTGERSFKKAEREEVVEKLLSDEIGTQRTDSESVYKLPSKYAYLSADGEVWIKEMSNGKKTVLFLTSNGFDAYSGYVYFPGETADKLHGYYIIRGEIKVVNDDWYYVTDG